MKKYIIAVLTWIFVFIHYIDLSGQNIGVGTSIPDYRLHITSADSSLLKLENSSSLNTNIRSSLFFKTGTRYTGAIKTIGTTTVDARLGFYTYASTTASLLKERLSILDNGNIGIDSKNPVFKLDVRNGSINVDSSYRIGTEVILDVHGKNVLVGKNVGHNINNINNENTCIGDQAGSSLTSGYFNSFIGSAAGYSDNTGYQNAFFGYHSGQDNTNGFLNAFFGTSSGAANMTGNSNSFFGQGSGLANISGDNNSFFGKLSGKSNITSDNNTAIGTNADVSTDGLTNATAIGANAQVDCSNCMVLGSVNGVNNGVSKVNVGIGTNSPAHPLSFAQVTGDKISLYNDGTNSYGFGIAGGLLQIHTNVSGADIAFGYGNNASFTERMRIKGSGFVGIGTPTPGYILDVNGRMRIKYNGAPAGLWLTDSGNSDEALIGMFTDQIVGFYSAGAGWNLVMNTTNGRVGVGTSSPSYPLDVITDSEPLAGRFVNTYVTGTTSGITGIATTATSGRGVVGLGKKTGVEAYADIAGSGDRFGLDSWGKNGTTNNYGARCEGTGGSIAYGIYAKGSGGTVNYGGYFVGDVYTSGSYLPSDRKLKNDIQPITRALDLVSKLKPSFYTYKTNDYKQMQLPEGIQYGLIADEVMQVIPGAVKKAIQPAEYENHDSTNGRKLSEEVEFNAVNYAEMIPILIGAIQEQQTVIANQQKQIDDLKKLVEELVVKK